MNTKSSKRKINEDSDKNNSFLSSNLPNKIPPPVYLYINISISMLINYIKGQMLENYRNYKI